jgi:hypothetical protein
VLHSYTHIKHGRREYIFAVLPTSGQSWRGIPKKKHHLQNKEGFKCHLSKHNISDYEVKNRMK